ncbi:MAG: hypothetical protein HC805_02230 [Alkalinema sp. RL_2_19]|nr:hypothetical protein [Alkalinema sp. RL_2_19]
MPQAENASDHLVHPEGFAGEIEKPQAESNGKGGNQEGVGPTIGEIHIDSLTRARGNNIPIGR